jgi:hypothetical protein
MEQKHKNRLMADYRRIIDNKPLHVLDIPDDYRYMDPALIALLEEIVPRYLASPHSPSVQGRVNGRYAAIRRSACASCTRVKGFRNSSTSGSAGLCAGRKSWPLISNSGKCG